jgi:hypothetical protein
MWLTSGVVQEIGRAWRREQMAINRANAERQYGAMTRSSRFETLNALAKLLENGEGRRRTHVLLQLIWEMMSSLFVLFGLKSQY